MEEAATILLGARATPHEKFTLMEWSMRLQTERVAKRAEGEEQSDEVSENRESQRSLESDQKWYTDAGRADDVAVDAVEGAMHAG